MQLQVSLIFYNFVLSYRCLVLSQVQIMHWPLKHFGERVDHVSSQASEDSLSVSYKFPAASVKPGSYVSLVACYTNFSTYDRPWRKPNAMDFRVRSQQLSSAVYDSCGLA